MNLWKTLKDELTSYKKEISNIPEYLLPQEPRRKREYFHVMVVSRKSQRTRPLSHKRLLSETRALFERCIRSALSDHFLAWKVRWCISDRAPVKFVRVPLFLRFKDLLLFSLSSLKATLFQNQKPKKKKKK